MFPENIPYLYNRQTDAFFTVKNLRSLYSWNVEKPAAAGRRDQESRSLLAPDLRAALFERDRRAEHGGQEVPALRYSSFLILQLLLLLLL